jgi:hypothetical protein
VTEEDEDEDEDMPIIKPTDMITVVEGYDAMRIFLETVWQRHGKPTGEIELLIGGLKWADGTPVHPALWEDWLAAVRVVCSRRTHETIESEN